MPKNKKIKVFSRAHKCVKGESETEVRLRQFICFQKSLVETFERVVSLKTPFKINITLTGLKSKMTAGDSRS